MNHTARILHVGFVTHDVKQTFYVCGPPAFVEDVSLDLRSLGADEASVVVEE